MLRGQVWKYGHNVDTDAIIPARYLNVSTPEELALHCMEDIDLDFAGAVQPGDIIVGGVCLASSPRVSPASSTGTPSMSACPSWSARRWWRRQRRVINWRWI